MVFEVVTFYNFLAEIQFSRSSPTITCNNKCQKWWLTFLFFLNFIIQHRKLMMFFFSKMIWTLFFETVFLTFHERCWKLFWDEWFCSKNIKKLIFQKTFFAQKNCFFFCSTFLTGKEPHRKVVNFAIRIDKQTCF